MKKYYTKQGLMEKWGISQSTLQRMMRKGLASIDYRNKKVFDIEEAEPFFLAWQALNPKAELSAELIEAIEKDIK